MKYLKSQQVTCFLLLLLLLLLLLSFPMEVGAFLETQTKNQTVAELDTSLSMYVNIANKYFRLYMLEKLLCMPKYT